uniref:Beta-barrel assembly machine subunit BamC n=1 Tax=Candidatus Kentrum sp. TUN TaxID=2126343 RepID=A0A451A233_9GAMM|nr:MAG: Beta-barrel assembly machine subunit BamC [Candidatus Kentron sp. TUN]VFK63970.1 MAG: Beta-barrel assembly machine subunit BamC [Candidatus Kentron sp. TUN]VFK69544.1 MAG: Beta-barrel assembly machine subunit BamC [Candidatus Kentron sp. TUN]
MRKTSWNRCIGCIIILINLSLTACSGLKETIDENLSNKVADYKTSHSLPPLEIPPDLVPPFGANAIEVPYTGTTTFSEYESGQGTQQKPKSVLPEFTGIHVMHDRDTRWLVIKANPDNIWVKVRDFWLKSGFLLEMEDPSIGIMETDWAENRADIPSGIIRDLLGKVFERAYSASTRDKFRVRLERGNETDTTELHLSHRGAEEVSQGETFVWQSRASDPELEAEMLSRMMVFLGLTKEKAQGMLAEKEEHATDRAYLIPGNKEKPIVLSVQEQFSRAWRRTRLALDRIGFTIEDRDRSRGLFYIRYIGPIDDTDEKGNWISKLKFWGKGEKTEETQYLISLREQPARDNTVVTTTHIRLLGKTGNPEQSATAERILNLLYEQLK